MSPDLFRARLKAVMVRMGLNAARFARGAGIDRSTLSQLLDDKATRLPRAETLVAVAAFSRVSVDWLLGLSQREQIGAEIIEAVMRIEASSRNPVDDGFYAWLKEATGYPVKTVPVTFPDFLKTEAVLRFEYAASLAVDPETGIRLARNRLDFCRHPDTQLEAAFPIQALEVFAAGGGIWKRLAADVRLAQLDHMRALCEELYPSIRLYLFDQRETNSVPFTVFGPNRAAIYLGHGYLVLNAIEHIRLFSQRFDELIRSSIVLPHQVHDHIGSMVS
jgi:transcriptional regulator with XRE-family HTH domain